MSTLPTNHADGVGEVIAASIINDIATQINANTTAIAAGLPPSGPAGGALASNFPNPTLAPGVATGSALGSDVVKTSTTLVGDVTGTVAATTIATSAVTTTKVASNAITAAKLANGAATGVALGGDVVITSQANIANGYAKPDGGNLLLAGMLGTGSPSSTTFLRGDRTWASGGSLFNSVVEIPAYFPGPNSGDSSDIRSSVSTSITAVGAIRTGGTGTTVDWLKNGVSILTAPLSLTTTSWTTGTLTTNPTTLAAGDILTTVLSGVSGSPTKVLAEAYGTRATV